MLFTFVRFLIAISITASILGGLFIYLIASNIKGMTVYKETDRYRYYTLTDKQIKNAPRISQITISNFNPATDIRHQMPLYSKTRLTLNRFEPILLVQGTSGSNDNSVEWRCGVPPKKHAAIVSIYTSINMLKKSP